MTKIYQQLLRSVLCIGLLTTITSVKAQNGDQILDGVGETAMSARYKFNGDAKDWSRNNLHAKLFGNGAKFVNDNQFGQVLSLTGEGNSFIALPAEVLTDMESISITGWVYLRSNQRGQRFFDFGQDANKHFSASPAGSNAQDGFQAAVSTAKGIKNAVATQSVPLNQWVNLAIVVDIPSKSITTYLNGKIASETKDIPLDLTTVFAQTQKDKNLLYIGK